MKLLALIFFLSIICAAQAQVTIDADGPGNTYELITSILAPGQNPIESPGETDGSCDNHTAFGRHISEVFDNDLNDNVFKFNIHVAEDNDRCKNFDRQRNEIKSYDQSPHNLLGIEGEVVQYIWKFKLDNNFQPSGSFTHLHQLKAVGGTEESMPLITLTARKSSPDRLELRYAESTSQVTLITADLSLFKGNWVEVIQTVEYGENGTYEINIKNVFTGTQILTYEDNDIRMWKTNADFIRPKWGIYRSLNNASDLRDEEVLFATFSITENPALSIPDVSDNSLFSLFPNPTKGVINFNFLENTKEYNISILDGSGKIIKNIKEIGLDRKIDLTDLSNGLYFIKLIDKETNTFSVKQLIKAN